MDPRQTQWCQLPDLSFGESESHFFNRNQACRSATCHDSIPHLLPVSYIFENGGFLTATYFQTKKYKSRKRNNSLVIVVDIYRLVGNKAVCIQGAAESTEAAQGFGRLRKKFRDRLEWSRLDPWKEVEAPFVKIALRSRASWGPG